MVNKLKIFINIGYLARISYKVFNFHHLINVFYEKITLVAPFYADFSSANATATASVSLVKSSFTIY